MSTFFQDLKFGARLLAKSPGFTIVAALSLALGIGANTTIFTLVNAVLLNPLPVEDPSQLVSVWTTDERIAGPAALGFLQVSPMNYKDLRDKNDVFSSLAGHAGVPLNISGGTGNRNRFLENSSPATTSPCSARSRSSVAGSCPTRTQRRAPSSYASLGTGSGSSGLAVTDRSSAGRLP